MPLNKIVKIGNQPIGQGNPVFIIVELGVCHEQNVDVAKHFVEIAKKYGANAVKVEAFRADNFVLDKSLMHKYGTADGMVEENYYQLLKRLELTFDEIKEIKKKADELGILFFSTVHDKEDADFFNELGVCAYKIASVDITHTPLIKYLCKQDKPVLMDTGGAYLNEIDESIRIFESEGFNDLILMHNPTGYPAPADKTDLRMIPALQNTFDIPVGLSCHTPGFDMIVASVAIGANVIEKPISRNKNIRSPEHIFSFQDTEAEKFIHKIRNTEVCMGNKRRTSIDESSHGRAKRRGLYAKKELPAGHILTEDDLLYRVPNKGIPSQDYYKILGKKLKKNYSKNEALQRIDIDE